MDHQRDCGSPLDRMDESILRMMLDEDFGGFSGSPVGASGGPRTASRRPTAERGAQRGGTDGGAGVERNATFSLPDLFGMPLAMVYSPAQRFDDLYDPETGLERGTIFRSLDLPFYPAACGTSCGLRR